MTKVSRPPSRRTSKNRRLQALLAEGFARTGVRPGHAADRVGLSPSLLSRALKDERDLPPQKAAALADILGISRVEVLAATGHPGAVDVDVASVVLQRSKAMQIKVITDPRFVDSALFWWIFSKQPFVSANIRCDLEKTQWGSVPALVAEHDLAIGFYNKQVLPGTIGGVPAFEVIPWADLTLYKGYALIGRDEDAAEFQRANTFDDAIMWLERIRKKAGNRKPVIVTMTGDPRQRLQMPRLKDRRLDPTNFELAVLPTADLAMRRFREGHGDLFVGGLPQRLALRQAPYVEVLHFGNNPFMASINSLICSPQVLRGHRDILYTAAGLWFETVKRMRTNERYCRMVAADIVRLLDEQGESHSLTTKLFIEVLGDKGSEYEVFADGPGALVESLLDTMKRVVLSVAGDQSPAPRGSVNLPSLVEQLGDVFSHFHDSFVAQKSAIMTAPEL